MTQHTTTLAPLDLDTRILIPSDPTKLTRHVLLLDIIKHKPVENKSKTYCFLGHVEPITFGKDGTQIRSEVKFLVNFHMSHLDHKDFFKVMLANCVLLIETTPDICENHVCYMGDGENVKAYLQIN
jgi:hypothetical protein